MTRNDLSCCCKITKEVLEEYDNSVFCGGVPKEEYTECDIEMLSLISTLREIGFDSCERKEYLSLMKAGSQADDKKLKMLNYKRMRCLEEIHSKENQLEKLDYIRHKLMCKCGGCI